MIRRPIARAVRPLIQSAFAATALCGTSTASGQSIMAWGTPGFRNIDDLSGVAGISAGFDHTVVVRSNGAVAAWGADGFRQCDVPTDLAPISAVAAGGGFTIAMRFDGSLTAWGQQPNQAQPPAVQGAVAIAAGRLHGMVLKSDALVACWG